MRIRLAHATLSLSGLLHLDFERGGVFQCTRKTLKKSTEKVASKKARSRAF
jgi:hypothetical protein